MYDVWKFEVECIIREGNYSDTIVLQCIRGSLKGKARSLLLSLPDGATTVQIIEKLDGVNGNVFSSEALLQTFYMETQKQGQLVADYGMILEGIAEKAIEKGQINTQAKNDMLRSKLWSGFRDPLLKNASRYKYDTVENFDQLLKEIRSIELDLSNYASGSENKIQHQPAVVEQTGIQEMIKSLTLLNTRMETFEGELKKLKDCEPDDTPSFSNTQFRGQGRGNYRGFNRRDEGFKRIKVSVEGQTRDLYRPENVPSSKLVDTCTQSILAQRMIGLVNESFVYINNTKCKALLDTGSMTSTISEDMLNYLTTPSELKSLDDFSLSIIVAGGTTLPYLRYIEAKIKVDFVEQDFVVPLLVVSLTDYNKTVPIIIDDAIGQVYSTNKNPIKLKPLSVLNVSGLARSKTPVACTVVTGNLSDDLSGVSVCLRVVNVKGSTCRVPARILNMTAKAMESSLGINLKNVDVHNDIKLRLKGLISKWRRIPPALFDETEIKYLGVILSADGIKTDPENVTAVQNWPAIENIKDLLLEPGDRVLLKNVAFRGNHKLDNKWGKQPYVIVSKPDSDILVYIIRQEHGRARMTVHRNMLLPITSIPILSPQCSENSHRKRNVVSEKNDCPSVLVDEILDSNKTADKITTDDQVVSNASCDNSDPDSEEEFLVHKCPRRRVDIIPPLNPLMDEFHPGILNLDEVSQRSSGPDSSAEQSDGQSSNILGVSEFSNPVPVSSESETSSDNQASSVSDSHAPYA
ncbi:unnamed protein product [Mytilus coruscus]|uniref:Uncharacterized protein n=1 Tax=Mytilus coruscus TaxID=42192 RepID=A0A6J8DJL2_MYTCO|nr:unnamed protein product [Mytilus coruscus]